VGFGIKHGCKNGFQKYFCYVFEKLKPNKIQFYVFRVLKKKTTSKIQILDSKIMVYK